jgi:hypothetical protein
MQAPAARSNRFPSSCSARTQNQSAAAEGRFMSISVETLGSSQKPATSASQAAHQPATSLPVIRRAAARRTRLVAATQRTATACVGQSGTLSKIPEGR